MAVSLLQANVIPGESIYLVRGDGAQLEVSSASASPSAAFYQTVTVSDGVLPQEPILDFDASGFTVTDVPGKTQTHVVNKAVATANQAQVPFHATLYADPSFVGGSTGAACTPFHTIADAINFAVFSGFTSALIIIPPGSTFTENVVFPSTGGNWEICSESVWGIFAPALINGTVTCDAVAFSRFALVNVQVSGAISGDASTSPFLPRLLLASVFALSTVSLSASGGGTWRVFCDGGASNTNSEGGTISGACTVAGAIQTSEWAFAGAVSWSLSSTFNATSFASPTLTNVSGANTATFYDCTFAANTNMTATAGSCVAALDGASCSNALAVGFICGANVTSRTLNSNASKVATIAANVGATNLSARAPAGLYQALSSLELLAAGTAGTAQVNVIYTDMTGTLQTKAVGGGLLITAGVGTEVTGTLLFHHNGATAIQYSVTGIVTPGAVSISQVTTVDRVD